MSTIKLPTVSDIAITSMMTEPQLQRAIKRIGREFYGRRTFVNIDPLLEFSVLMTAFEDFESDIDWSRSALLAGIPKDILDRVFSVSFSSGKKAAHWFSAELSFGALAFLCSRPCRNAEKERRGLVLSSFHGLKRQKQRKDSEGVAAVCGMSLDDDGVIGRGNIRQGPLVIAFSTANDGKSHDTIDREAFEIFTRRSGLGTEPTIESLSLFLNDGLEHGPAYRNIVLDAGLIGGELQSSYSVAFEPQQRTRFLVLFDTPVEGELLNALLAKPDAYNAFGELVEYEALAARGTDKTCFDPVRVGYLPSGMNPTPYFSILGGPYFLNPIPLAEKALQASPSRKAPRGRSVSKKVQERAPAFKGIRAPYRGKLHLKGLRLASYLVDHHPELVQSRNALKPLLLSLCPFADEHRSKRGKADGSLYCYDPDPGFSDYPVMRCRHQTCADRLTEDFVEAMIEQGLLDPAVFQANSNCMPRPISDCSLPNLNADWRQHISNK